MKTRVLLVGEDQAPSEETRSAPGGEDAAWEFHCARSGPEALAVLAQSQFTAVVADLRLPGATGVQLLDEVVRRHPGVLRFIRSEIEDREATMQCVGTAHQFLLKPTEVQTLKSAVERALSFEVWLPNQSVQALIASFREIPSPPELYFQVVEALQSANASLEAVAALIGKDPAMTAKLLQLVNSAVFGLQLQVSQPLEAVMYLGVETTASLILLAHTFSYFDQLKLSDFSIESLWQHSLVTGQCARWIATIEAAGDEVNAQAFTGGLLHDLGKLALAVNRPEEFQRALSLTQETGFSLWETEREVFGVTHAEAGACLLSIWGLPAPIVEAVALHHTPALLLSRVFAPLTAVHVANVLGRADQSPVAEGSVAQVDLRYLEELGLASRLAEWQRLSSGQPWLRT